MDAAGRPLTLTLRFVPNIFQVYYGYDPLNRLAAAYNADTNQHNSTLYNYDNVGNLASVVAPNGIAHNYTYDTRNRLTNLGVSGTVAGVSGTIASYAYTLDVPVSPPMLFLRLRSGQAAVNWYVPVGSVTWVSRESHFSSQNLVSINVRYNSPSRYQDTTSGSAGSTGLPCLP